MQIYILAKNARKITRNTDMMLLLVDGCFVCNGKAKASVTVQQHFPAVRKFNKLKLNLLIYLIIELIIKY